MIDNFYLLQLLALEREALTRALKFQSANCKMDRLLLNVDLKKKSEITINSYRELVKLSLDEAVRETAEIKRSSQPSAR